MSTISGKNLVKIGWPITELQCTLCSKNEMGEMQKRRVCLLSSTRTGMYRGVYIKILYHSIALENTFVMINVSLIGYE